MRYDILGKFWLTTNLKVMVVRSKMKESCNLFSGLTRSTVMWQRLDYRWITEKITLQILQKIMMVIASLIWKYSSGAKEPVSNHRQWMFLIFLTGYSRFSPKTKCWNELNFLSLSFFNCAGNIFAGRNNAFQFRWKHNILHIVLIVPDNFLRRKL